MSIRVIGGEFGGRNLEAVPGFGTRPLLGQVREALFNILGDVVVDAVVWDLFAGTGASGIEALSRGARRVIFVEKGGRALKVLRSNLAMIDPDSELDVEIVRANAWNPPLLAARGVVEPTDDAPEDDVPDDDEADDDSMASESLEEAPDLVFLDPPYPDVREDPTRAVARLAAILERCAPGGRVVFHFPDGVLDEDDFDRLGDVDLRTWGQAAVAIVRKISGRSGV